MPERPQPDVMMDPKVHMCARHLEPFRARWPVGVLPMLLALFETAIRREDVLRAAGASPTTAAELKILDRVLREYGPLCCLIGDVETKRWTNLALGEIYVFAVAYDALREQPGWDPES